MGISWDDVGRFGVGLTHGVGQGMDLYGQYSALQEKKDLTQRKRAAEQASAQVFQSGEYDADPINATKKLATIWAGSGFMDEAMQFDQLAQTRRESMAKEAALRAWQLSDISLDASVQALGEFNKAMGKGDQIQLVTASDGRRQLQATIDGQPFQADLADLDTYKGMLGQYLGPVLMGSEEYFKAVPEVGLTNARAALTGQQAISEDVLRAPQADLLAAQAEGQRAGAMQSLASADYLGQQAQWYGPQTQAEIEGTLAGAAANRGQAALYGQQAQWYGPQTQAEIGLTQAQTQGALASAVGQDIENRAGRAALPYAGPMAAAQLGKTMGEANEASAQGALAAAKVPYAGHLARADFEDTMARAGYNQAAAAKMRAEAAELANLTGMAGYDAGSMLELVQSGQPTDEFGEPDPSYDPIGRTAVALGVGKGVAAAGQSIDPSNAAAIANTLALPEDVGAAKLDPSGLVLLQSRTYGVVPITQEGLGALNAMRMQQGQQPIVPARAPAGGTP